MLCENCGKNQANVKYTQIINGVKKEMNLCEECSKKLGISDMEINMPINFSSFLSEFFDDNDTMLLPSFNTTKELSCDKCGMTFNEFTDTGKFGCANCYDAFSDKIDSILKKLHGANRHVGRVGKITNINLDKMNIEKEEIKENKCISKIDKLKEDLKKAIEEERYEDAANIRDKIKKLEI